MLRKTLLLYLALTPWMASAQPTVEVGFDAHSVPTQYVNSAGEVAGIYPSIVRRAFEIAGQPVRLVALPFRRLVDSLSTNRRGAGALVKTPDRSRYSDYSAPYFIETVSVYRLKTAAPPYKSVKDLEDASVGVISGWAYGEQFDQASARQFMRTEGVESDLINFRKLVAHRIDFAVATTSSGRLLQRRAEFRSIEEQGTPLTSVPIHLAFNKRQGNGPLLSRFNAAIAEMHASGELQQIADRELQRASLER
jgi:polar amino acid transport system substrate-binding protein